MSDALLGLPSTSLVATTFLPANAKITPMLKQWLEAKAKAPDAILLFRMGDFYELFAADAEAASPILGLALTSRDKDNDHAVAMAGFPHHSAPAYIAKLVSQGLKVAVCDQLEDPRTCKGIVKRDITRIVTPGTILEDDLLSPKANNFLVSVVDKNGLVAVSALDISTGDFLSSICSFERMTDEILRYSPKEILFYGTENTQNSLLSLSQKLSCRIEPRKLESVLPAVGMLDRWFDENIIAKESVAILLKYVSQTVGDTSHLRSPKPHSSNQKMILDATTQAHLNIVGPVDNLAKKGSLLHVIDKSITAMGGRFLLQCLQLPETSLDELNKRYAIVDYFVSQGPKRRRVREVLKSVFDLERLLAKCANNRINPREVAHIRSTIFSLPELAAILDQLPADLSAHIGKVAQFSELGFELGRSLVEMPSLNVKEADLFQSGYDAALDNVARLCSGGIQEIAFIENREREKTGINSLKVKYTRVFGYYIEVTRTHLEKVPDYFQRKQTVANGERYITPELQSLELQISSAENQRQERQQELFAALCQKVLSECANLLAAAQCIARLDFYASLAELAQNNAYVQAQMLPAAANKIDICQGRHPILENLAQEKRAAFVPNDLYLDENKQLMLLTGPNMGGKSTIMRQVGLIQVLAQIGSFVPAQKATLSICDRIFTRVGADDDMVNGRSTFMVEMNEAANILHHASEHSLVLLDEIGRGTSTYDGLSLAYAILEHLHERKKCKTIFATHYHELTLLSQSLPKVHSAHVQVQEKKGSIEFLYTLSSGAANRSYGIQVAKLAGLPAAVLERAAQILSSLEQKNTTDAAVAVIKKSEATPQLDFFKQGLVEKKQEAIPPAMIELIDNICQIPLEQMTPMQAFYALDKIRTMAKSLSDIR